jgi:hypothetical protein
MRFQPWIMVDPGAEFIQPGDESVAGSGAVAGDHQPLVLGGTAVIAACITAGRSAVVSDPAPPLPSIPASASVVLSQ